MNSMNSMNSMNNKLVNRKLKTWDFSSKFLIRKGLIDTFYRQNKTRYSKEIKSLGAWTRESLSDLGPTFIKLGQTLSTRNDLFPVEFIKELEYLQDDVIEIDPNDVKSILVSELNDSVENSFQSFDYKPRKCASLGQVHFGVLRSGKKVAVKIQRPGLKEIIEDDISNIIEILDFFEKIGLSTGPSSKLVFFEAREKLINELDYSLEARNAVKFRRIFENSNLVIVPRVYLSKSTDKLLIMEWINGIKITNTSQLVEYGIDLKELSKNLIQIFIIQIMEYGFFHADPHPGNISVDKSGKLVLYDYGLIIKLPEELTNESSNIINLLIQGDTSSLVDLFVDIGIIKLTGNKNDIIIFFNQFINYIQKVDNFTDPYIKEFITNKLSQEKPFIISDSFIFLGKSLTLLEGICVQLDPEFNFITYVKPYVESEVSIDLQKMALNTFEIPSKINNINNAIEQQKSEINIKLNKYEEITKNNSYLFLYLSIINALIDSDNNINYNFLFFIFSFFFIFLRNNGR